MNRFIYKGLIIETTCKYFHIHPGCSRSLVQHKDKDLYELTYIPGDTTYQLSNLLGIPKIGKEKVLDDKGMGLPEKYRKTTITLNGFSFDKLTYDIHTIRIVIVGDNESRVIQDYDRTTLVVNKDDYRNPEFIDFLLYSGNLKYISPSERPKGKTSWSIRNFPKISVKDKNLNLTSDSETVYQLRNVYDQYLIRSIDYQDQFITEIARILDEYGIELARVNREKTLTKSSYISYMFSQTPVKYNHPHYADPDSGMHYHKLPVDFTFRCADMVMYYDFKNRFNNVDLLTNFCEFKTTDKYGSRWSAAVKWGQITEDFNQMYQGDDNSNFSFQCQFRCELYFYEVYDNSIEFIKEILYELEVADSDNTITGVIPG